MPRPPRRSTHPHAGFTWADHVDFMIEQAGSLAAAAARISEKHAHRDSAASIERALRRLRGRVQEDGGKWGERAIATFGAPDSALARVMAMGSYHGRFTDLPVPVCEELVALWDRPPLGHSPACAAWLALGRTTNALRREDLALADLHLQRAERLVQRAHAQARVEAALVRAFVASRTDTDSVPALLDRAESALGQPEIDPEERACLRARLVDQRAYELNRRRGRRPPDHAAAERLLRALPEDGPPFARCRRASGLAYVRWKQGDVAEGASFARDACRHAGDGGHVRLRAMALALLARIVGGEEADRARARAAAIAKRLEDETLALRFARLPPME